MLRPTAAALDAGIRPGDLLVALDGEPVRSMTDLQRLMVRERIGVTVSFGIVRGERMLDIPVVPDELSE